MNLWFSKWFYCFKNGFTVSKWFYSLQNGSIVYEMVFCFQNGFIVFENGFIVFKNGSMVLKMLILNSNKTKVSSKISIKAEWLYFQF